MNFFGVKLHKAETCLNVITFGINGWMSNIYANFYLYYDNDVFSVFFRSSEEALIRCL